MTPREVLFATADYLDRHGWVQHTYVGDNGAACVIGAADSVWCGDSNREALRLFSNFVATNSIGDWNDAYGRTQVEVVTKLRACAESLS